uniref:G-protein coupled receptors family 2 profile 2 domain-containing protein n=1 Tax=Amphimedon queenslandica TaxID=400682 RepID=A0A1X7V9I7_AMPQE
MQRIMSNDTCLFLSLNEVRTLGIIRSSVALISALSCLGAIVLVLLLARKQWGLFKFTKRLSLYLTILALLYSVATTFQWVSSSAIDEQPGGEQGCKAVAFFVQYLSWSLLVFTFLLTLILFITVYKRKELHFTRWEIGTLLASILSPLITVWIPFINDSYGLSGIWCWIRSHDSTNCTVFLPGVIEQIALWYAPLSILMIASSVLMFMTIGKYIYSVFKSCGYQKIDTDSLLYQNSFKDYSPLVVYPIVFFSLNVIALSSRIASTQYVFPKGLLYIHSIVDPCWGLIASIATIIYSMKFRNMGSKSGTLQ